MVIGLHFFFCSNYESYFNVLPVDALRDQSLFWSRTSSLVEILSMMNAMVNVVSSANSIPSEAINNIPIEGQLNWCGIAGGKNVADMIGLV